MSDIEVLKEIRSGNYSEFSVLYKKYFERIYRYIYSKTYKREITEDICSNTFIKALENVATFQGDGSKIISWIYVIARNQIIDYYRTDRNEKSVDDIWDLSSPEDIEVDLINRESFKQLHSGLHRIKATEREIITMHLWEDMTFKEIASNLGIKEGKCKMVFYRSLKKLKKDLKHFVNLVLSLKPLLLTGGHNERTGFYE